MKCDKCKKEIVESNEIEKSQVVQTRLGYIEPRTGEFEAMEGLETFHNECYNYKY